MVCESHHHKFLCFSFLAFFLIFVGFFLIFPRPKFCHFLTFFLHFLGNKLHVLCKVKKLPGGAEIFSKPSPAESVHPGELLKDFACSLMFFLCFLAFFASRFSRVYVAVSPMKAGSPRMFFEIFKQKSQVWHGTCSNFGLNVGNGPALYALLKLIIIHSNLHTTYIYRRNAFCPTCTDMEPSAPTRPGGKFCHCAPPACLTF